MENLFTFSPLVVLIVPVVLGLVQAAKKAGLETKWAPIVSILVGIGLVALTGQPWQADIAQGIIIGLAASGLWSDTKDQVAKAVALMAPKKLP
ncbi:MAG: holin [Patescibacteria group bacterium]|nr:holin [Patescibacteria group bacterium]